MLDRSDACFDTTQWTLVAGLESPDEADRQRARDALIRLYWPAVYAFLRRKGLGRDEAAETTESFFVDVVLGRELLYGAAPAKGKLRTLVLTALQRYQVDLSRRAAARGAGLRAPVEALDREDAATSPQDSPERAFDRRWALAIVQDAAARCEGHFRGAGKPGHWLVFEARVLQPAAAMIEPRPLAALLAPAGFRSEADAASAVQVVKKRFLAVLSEIAATDGAEAGDVMQALR